MRAALIASAGSPVAPNISVVDDWPDPAPRLGDVLVRTEASALNHLDLWVGAGIPGLDLSYPRISGSDACGRVESVGEGVDTSWIGKRVVLNAAVPTDRGDISMIGEHDPGVHAELFVAPESNVADIGEVEAVEAAAFGLVHLTAWRMLVTRAALRSGMDVLITGIGGGVALAALGIAGHLGCRTIVTSRHQWKLDRAIELGASEAVLDEGDDWSRAVRSHCDGRGVDVCVDSIGAAVHGPALRSLARGGTLVTCGCTSGPNATTDLARIFWNQLSLLGSTMGDMAEFEASLALLRDGSLSPVIDSVHEAQDAATAFERLEGASQFGKVVIRWQ